MKNIITNNKMQAEQLVQEYNMQTISTEKHAYSEHSFLFLGGSDDDFFAALCMMCCCMSCCSDSCDC